MPKKKINLPLIEIIIVSLLVHVIGLFIFGGLVLWSELSAPEPDLQAPPVAAPVQDNQVVRIKPRDIRPPTSKARIVVKTADIDLKEMDIPTLPTDGRVAFGNFGEGGDGLGFGDMAGDKLPDFQSLFGRDSSLGGDLEGTFYDLKQDRNGKPTNINTGSDYTDITQEFERRSWSDNVLSKFFSADKKLYASTFIIPTVSADSAPEAYGVQDQVEPSRWVAHYKGNFVAPENGAYRFWGYADDMMLVRINNRTVLDGSRKDTKYSRWESKEPEHKKYPIGNGLLGVGDWFTIRKGEKVPMEVLIGERPGGRFGAYLLIERRGAQYKMIGDRPVLPIFTTSPLAPAYIDELRNRLGNDLQYIDLGNPIGEQANATF